MSDHADPSRVVQHEEMQAGSLRSYGPSSLAEPEASPLRWRLSADEERDVLNFEPWGDRDAAYTLLRQSFVRVRATHQCAICFGPIVVGERVWSRTEADDGKAATFRFCAECCWCIAHRSDEDWTDDGWGHDAWTRMDERWELGRRRAEAQR